MRMVVVHCYRSNSILYHDDSIVNYRVINYNREECHTRLCHGYFSDTPTYT